jgi:hypothetical protein
MLVFHVSLFMVRATGYPTGCMLSIRLNCFSQLHDKRNTLYSIFKRSSCILLVIISSSCNMQVHYHYLHKCT